MFETIEFVLCLPAAVRCGLPVCFLCFSGLELRLFLGSRTLHTLPLFVPGSHLHLGSELHDRRCFTFYNSIFVKTVVFDFALPHSSYKNQSSTDEVTCL